MAIKGQYSFQKTGVTSSEAYVKISSCHVINTKETSRISIIGAIFYSKTIRDTTGCSLEPFECEALLTGFTQNGEIFQDCYNYIKGLSKFSGFIDA